MEKRSKTRLIVEGAMMIALALILSYIKLFSLPQGGSITLELVPLIFMSLRNGTKWGVITGLSHGLLTMLLNLSTVMYCNTLLSQIACILLDYLLAFMVLGFAHLFSKLLPKAPTAGKAIGAVAAGLLRFLCSFLSGIFVWGGYAPEGQNVVIYSLTYNGAYMLPNICIAAVIIVLLYKAVPKLFTMKQ